MDNNSGGQAKAMIPSALEKTEQTREIETKNESGTLNDRSNACHSLIQNYLAGTSDLSSTIQDLLSSFKESSASGAELLEECLQDVWFAILHAAKHVSFHDTPSHNKLVDLVRAILNSRLTGASLSSEESLKLQSLGMCSREVYNDQPGSGTGFSAPEISAWTNVNYFWALVKNEDIMSYMYDIWALRQGLEQDHVDDEPEDAYQPASATQKYDAYIPAAAAWIFGQGKKLYLTEMDLTPTDSCQGNPGRGGDLWKGRAEYSKERWALWKRRFEDISKRADLREETRKIAKEAVDAMSEAE